MSSKRPWLIVHAAADSASGILCVVPTAGALFQSLSSRRYTTIPLPRWSTLEVKAFGSLQETGMNEVGIKHRTQRILERLDRQRCLPRIPRQLQSSAVSIAIGPGGSPFGPLVSNPILGFLRIGG